MAQGPEDVSQEVNPGSPVQICKTEVRPSFLPSFKTYFGRDLDQPDDSEPEGDPLAREGINAS